MYHVLTDEKIPDLSQITDLPELIHSENCHSITRVAGYSKEIIEYVVELLNKNGFLSMTITEEKEDDIYIEYHVYNCTTNNGTIESRFAAHQDNYGATLFNVNTCIIYLENTFGSGGELVILRKDSVLEEDVIERIRPEPNKIVLMSGEQWHTINAVHGLGVRRCLVFQVRVLET